MRIISWPAEDVLASQEGLCAMELLSFIFGGLRITLFYYVSVSSLLPSTMDNDLNDTNWDGADQRRLDD